MSTIPTYKRYWPAPPLINSVYEYQNVNKDLTLRKKMTETISKKMVEWIENDSDFSKFKNKKNYITSVDGMMDIYKLLRQFVKKSGLNWYDLLDHVSSVKKYLYKHF
jgi:hypothetical protein